MAYVRSFNDPSFRVEPGAFMNAAYRLSIFYFALFALLLIGSAVLLHGMKIGYGVEELNRYYLGDTAAYVTAKSSEGVLKTAVPHLGGVGLFVMVSAHFFLFASPREKRRAKPLALLLIVTGMLNTLLPLLISAGAGYLIWLKLLSFTAFVFGSLWLLWLLCVVSFSGLVQRKCADVTIKPLAD